MKDKEERLTERHARKEENADTIQYKKIMRSLCCYIQFACDVSCYMRLISTPPFSDCSPAETFPAHWYRFKLKVQLTWLRNKIAKTPPSSSRIRHTVRVYINWDKTERAINLLWLIKMIIFYYFSKRSIHCSKLDPLK